MEPAGRANARTVGAIRDARIDSIQCAIEGIEQKPQELRFDLVQCDSSFTETIWARHRQELT
jgi:hypothetical protein